MTRMKNLSLLEEPKRPGLCMTELAEMIIRSITPPLVKENRRLLKRGYYLFFGVEIIGAGGILRGLPPHH